MLAGTISFKFSRNGTSECSVKYQLGALPLAAYSFINPSTQYSRLSQTSISRQQILSCPRSNKTMSPLPDLTLPPTFPRLSGYGKYAWGDSSFSLYSIIETSEERLKDIAAALDAEWYEEQGFQGSHLVRVAPSPIHKSLADILEVHANLEKVAPDQDEQKFGALDLEWYPTAFIVVTAETLEDRGLLFVFVDDESEDESEEDGDNDGDNDGNKTTEFPLDKFFFEQKDAHSMLSTLMYDDDSAARAKEIYGY
jgi:hypothetical protein